MSPNEKKQKGNDAIPFLLYIESVFYSYSFTIFLPFIR